MDLSYGTLPCFGNEISLKTYYLFPFFLTGVIFASDGLYS